MSKAMLIMDMPKCCAECQLYVKGKYRIDKCRITMLDMSNKYGKPSWCPLREVPEKNNDRQYKDEYMTGYRDGYNVCIDEILGN